MNQQGFIKFAAFAAFTTVLTTLGVHFIEFEAITFEDRLRLAHDPLYLGQKWMVIFHCLMVIVSMYGVAILADGRQRGLAGLGALFIAVFGIAEITRMLAVFAYLNPLKVKYAAAQDEISRQVIQLQIEGFGMAATTLFLLFIFAFALGNLFLGLALTNKRGKDRWMAWLLMAWGLLTLLTFGNHFWENPAAAWLGEITGKFVQPLFRLSIGWWLLQKAREHSFTARLHGSPAPAG